MAKIGIKVEVTEEGTVQKEFGSRRTLPNGDYRLELIASDVIEKDKGRPDHSIMVKGTACVIEPEEFKGQWVFVNYNLMHKNAEAMRIGGEQFQCLLGAVGLTELGEDDDTETLHFRAFMAKVGLGNDSKTKNADGTPQYPAKPEIKKYYFEHEENYPAPSVTEAAIAAAAAHDARVAAAATPTPANDNKPAVRPAAAAPAEKGKSPWAKKAV